LFFPEVASSFAALHFLVFVVQRVKKVIALLLFFMRRPHACESKHLLRAHNRRGSNLRAATFFLLPRVLSRFAFVGTVSFANVLAEVPQKKSRSARFFWYPRREYRCVQECYGFYCDVHSSSVFFENLLPAAATTALLNEEMSHRFQIRHWPARIHKPKELPIMHVRRTWQWCTSPSRYISLQLFSSVFSLCVSVPRCIFCSPPLAPRPHQHLHPYADTVSRMKRCCSSLQST
jgi:hypothetical protein